MCYQHPPSGFRCSAPLPIPTTHFFLNRGCPVFMNIPETSLFLLSLQCLCHHHSFFRFFPLHPSPSFSSLPPSHIQLPFEHSSPFFFSRTRHSLLLLFA